MTHKKKVISRSIPVNEPILDGNEKKYLDECIDTAWISSEGPFIQQFEQSFAKKVNRKFGIAVCNGSAALDAAVAALEIGPGDEVIMPSFTIISCAASVVRAGAVPVLVDADEQTWNMDTGAIEARITSRTRAIMVVHIYGLPVDIERVLEIAGRYKLAVIEDAAEMHGQTYRGEPCGSFGDISTFSFYPNKHITTGEGGMLVTNSDLLANRCRSLRNLCFQPEKRFVHEELGWNLRMTNMQAALGLAQLERLDTFVEKKRRMGAFYTASFLDIAGIQLPLSQTGYAENIFWVYGIVLGDHIPFDAAEAMRFLAAEGIGTRPFFWGMHEQPVFRKMGLFAGERYSVTERLARRGFYIPSGLGLSEDQMTQCVDAVRKLFIR